VHVLAGNARVLPLGTRHGFTEQLPRAEVGEWLARREALWKTLEGHDFESLSLGRAYRSRCSGEPGPLRDAVAAGREHWECVCRGLLAVERDRAGVEQAIARLAASPAVRL
jgi:hypothetical protein